MRSILASVFDSTDEATALTGTAAAMVLTSIGREHADPEGSRPGKRANIDRAGAEQAARLYRDYFSENPTYPEEVFERRYRLPRSIFLRVHHAVVADGPYFQQSSDALGKTGRSPYQKTDCGDEDASVRGHGRLSG